MAKLQNIKAIKEMLNNKHFSQNKTVIGYTKQEDITKREVGDIWEEVQPDGTVIKWEQKKGYRVKVPKNLEGISEIRSYLKEYPNCYDTCEKGKTKKYTRYDEDVRLAHGMCLDCLARFETELKIKGEWEDYERRKKLEYLTRLFEDAEIEKNRLKESLEKVSYVNSDGSEDKWEIDNKEELLRKIDEDFYEAKKLLLDPLLEKEVNESDL